jgi:hypothetical protein
VARLIASLVKIEIALPPILRKLKVIEALQEGFLQPGWGIYLIAAFLVPKQHGLEVPC